MGKPKTFILGTDTATGKPIRLPYDIVTRRGAVFGMSGSGKSNSATVMQEELIRRAEQVIQVDPKGEGWGLRVGFDGKPTGGLNVVVFGEPHADLPLHVEHAERIADFAVDTGSSIVLSTIGFGSDKEERRFIARFMKRLYRRKANAKRLVRTLVVLEEAHLAVPQTAGTGSGEYADLVGSIKRIARQGRSAGMGTLIVDQRPAEVANSVITQSEILIVHQLAHASDRDALNKWVKAYDKDGNAETFFATLAELEPGEAWVWSPAWLKVFARVKINRRTTLDTGDPANVKAVGRAKLTPIDLDKLKDELAHVVEAAEAVDPTKLQQQIKRIEAANAKLTTDAASYNGQVESLTLRVKELLAQPKADPATIEKAVKQALLLRDACWRQELQNLRSPITPAFESLRSAVDAINAIGQVNGTADIITAVMPKTDQLKPTPIDRDKLAAAERVEQRLSLRPKPAPTGTTRATPIAHVVDSSPTPVITQQGPFKGQVDTALVVNDLKLGKAHREILDTLAWWESVGERVPVWPRVAAVIGKHARNKGLMNARGQLKTAGLLTEDYHLTDTGRAAARIPDTPPTLAALHNVWRKRLKGKEREIFDLLIAAGGAMTWADIIARLDVHERNKGAMNARGRLNNTHGLTTWDGTTLRGTDLMYPEGLT